MTAAARIICVGNRLLPDDDLGPRIHDLLAAGSLPDGIELYDGGLQGLALARLVDGARRVVFVDSIAGFGMVGEILTLSRQQIADLAAGKAGHAAGLPELFHFLPHLCDPLPDILLVGGEVPVSDGILPAIAERALSEAMRP